MVAPVIAEHYEQHTFPYDIVRQMGKMGLFGLPFPEEYGGMGGDYFALCLALEELARVDSLGGDHAGGGGLARRDADLPLRHRRSRRRTWLPRLVSGEALAAFGLTEPGFGSDAGGTAHPGGARRDAPTSG